MTNPIDRDKLVYLGRIGRPHGLKGAFAVYPYAGGWDRFRELKQVVLVGPRATVTTEIRAARIAPKSVILQTTACDTPEDVRAFVNGDVAIPETDRPQLPKGQYYYDQLVGLAVVDTEGTERGTVTEVVDYPASDVCVVESSEGRSRLVPLTENILERVELDNRRLIVRALPGLFDD